MATVVNTTEKFIHRAQRLHLKTVVTRALAAPMGELHAPPRPAKQDVSTKENGMLKERLSPPVMAATPASAVKVGWWGAPRFSAVRCAFTTTKSISPERNSGLETVATCVGAPTVERSNVRKKAVVADVSTTVRNILPAFHSRPRMVATLAPAVQMAVLFAQIKLAAQGVPTLGRSFLRV